MKGSLRSSKPASNSPLFAHSYLPQMKLTKTQANIVQLAANAELRTPEQMLSLLLIEGIIFYFMDRNTMRGGAEIDVEEAERQLIADAINQIVLTHTA
jgi:hypothetical protein